MSDIAKQLGIAPSTVSNALSGRRFVEPELRQRILETADALDYRPSGIARALRLQRTSTIALMVADFGSSNSLLSVRAIEDEALPENYQLIICNTSFDEEREARHIDLLVDQRVNGVIVMSSSLHDVHIKRLQQESIHTVQLSRRSMDVSADFVGVNNFAGIESALTHLWELGHREIVFLGGQPETSSVTQEKLRAFNDGIAKRGTSPAPFIATDFSFEDGYRAMVELLEDPDRRFTAVLAVNDMTALAAIDAALERGLRVPQDLSVVGWDDSVLASLRTVQLTTVRQPMYEMGRAAARLLLQRLNGTRDEPTAQIFDPELIVRGTTAPPAHSAPTA
ncbi:MAG: LacI family DNA-binding transcriptional regulator [Thermomicrobiales bacterium]|nr:LacI family DNA-binding transcriptional regulator [Thermomicrobiales bacterium]MCO5220709.1 LacI family transcriptional regulator [Thermomicrobiales bacterium]